MTKEEALRVSEEQGVAITHRYFSNNEWMQVSRNGKMLLLEDGVKCSVKSFFNDRMDQAWEEDWEIKKI